jgi:homoserine O-acetyltransferase
MTSAQVIETSLLEHEIVGPTNAPVLLVLGGISATRHVVRTAADPSPGWWEGVAGPGRALNTATHRLLSVEFADGGRGPDGRPVRVVTTHDQAALIIDRWTNSASRSWRRSSVHPTAGWSPSRLGNGGLSAWPSWW